MIIGDYLTADVFEIEDGSVWVLGFMSLAAAYVEACNTAYLVSGSIWHVKKAMKSVFRACTQKERVLHVILTGAV